MSLVSQSAICLHRATRAVELLDDLGWEACAFSQRDPFKSSPNEDSALVIPSGNESVVLAVADGCGGMRGGDQASRLAIRLLSQSIKRSLGKPRLIRNAILDGIERANEAIQSLKIGAACTIAIVEFHRGSIRSYHVGDSMVLVTTSRGRIRYQSLCHSPIGYAVESGLIAAEDAMHHEDRHLISNYVGSPQMRIEVGPSMRLSKNDSVLVASDGLFDNLSIQEVVRKLRQGKLETCVGKLAKLASKRMQQPSESAPSKPDDLTMIALRGQLF